MYWIKTVQFTEIIKIVSGLFSLFIVRLWKMWIFSTIPISKKYWWIARTTWAFVQNDSLWWIDRYVLFKEKETRDKFCFCTELENIDREILCKTSDNFLWNQSTSNKIFLIFRMGVCVYLNMFSFLKHTNNNDLFRYSF